MDVTTTLEQRGSKYGDFTDVAGLTQELLEVLEMFHTMNEHGKFDRPWPKLDNVKRQALIMIMNKIARILSGDPDYKDNWHDIQGYAKLAEDRCLSPRE